MSDKHKELSLTAIHWLYNNGCTIFANEVPTRNGVADALGIKMEFDTGFEKIPTVYYLEVKVSRSDLICSKQKCCYLRSIDPAYKNGIDFYYLLVADGVTVEKEIYPNWGVINEAGKCIRKAKRIKKDNHFESRNLIIDVAHSLVYKVFGKLYLN